jgi:hypothetical protein
MGRKRATGFQPPRFKCTTVLPAPAARQTSSETINAAKLVRIPLLAACLILSVQTFTSNGASGKEIRDLDADRDAFTPTTVTVDVGHALVETAYTFIDNREGPETHSFPELLLRKGLTEWLELRLGANQEIGSGGNVVTAIETGEGLGEELSAETSIFYGLKARLTDQADWVPRSVVIVEAFTPVAGDVWGTEPVASIVWGWELPEHWRFDAAFRYVYADSEEGTFNKWQPSAVLRMPLAERVEVHAEWFGTWTDGLENDTVRPFAGPGFHWVIGKGFELGVRMGWGLTHDAANYFVDAGTAYRF